MATLPRKTVKLEIMLCLPVMKGTISVEMKLLNATKNTLGIRKFQLVSFTNDLIDCWMHPLTLEIKSLMIMMYTNCKVLLYL